METILIRKGLNGFRYSACGEKGNFLFNANQIAFITRHWSKEHENGTVRFIRQLSMYPDKAVEEQPPQDATIGQRMRTARETKGYTQKECAKMLDVPAKSYSAMERDKTYIPKHKAVVLAVLLHVNTEWLLKGTGKMEIGGNLNYEED